MLRTSFSVAYLLLALCLFTAQSTLASDNEIWWATAAREAEQDGYKLIDTKGLAELIDSASRPLILDVRADYEFEAGHLPGSANLEFDLGDRMDLPKGKREAFEKLVGSDKKRRLVIYCRSFR